MAMVAYQRARKMVPQGPVFGVGCTAAIATDRQRRGEDRCHLALQSADSTRVVDIALSKTLGRGAQESICSELVISLMAEALHISVLEPVNSDITTVSLDVAVGERDWQRLLAGETDTTQDVVEQAVFPGAFNPMHQGHLDMIRYAEQKLGRSVILEISIRNVDKPPLDYLSMRERRDGAGDHPVVFTNAPTFVEKSRLFPGSVFIVGADTLARIDDPIYYTNRNERDAAVLEMAERRIQFLVFGRTGTTGFMSLEDLSLSAPLRALCTGVPEDDFRADVSSTELRKSKEENDG